MLFLHEKLTATASRQNDVVARVRNIHSYMQKHPGFIRARVARYLGDPNEYLVMRWWRSAEDLAEHGRNPIVPDWGANRPEGIYLVPPKTTRWESVTAASQPWTGFFLRTILKPTAVDPAALLADLTRHTEDAISKGEMTSADVFTASTDSEFAGGVLLLAGFEDRDAFNRYLESKDGAEFANPNPQFETLLTGCFELVEEALPEGAVK